MSKVFCGLQLLLLPVLSELPAQHTKVSPTLDDLSSSDPECSHIAQFINNCHQLKIHGQELQTKTVYILLTIYENESLHVKLVKQ